MCRFLGELGEPSTNPELRGLKESPRYRKRNLDEPQPARSERDESGPDFHPPKYQTVCSADLYQCCRSGRNADLRWPRRSKYADSDDDVRISPNPVLACRGPFARRDCMARSEHLAIMVLAERRADW